jgi:hypothetical protein
VCGLLGAQRNHRPGASARSSSHPASRPVGQASRALTAALRALLPGYAAAPDTIQRRFLETPGQLITTGDTTTVRLERRAYSPVLRKADLPPATTVPWWGNRTLRYGLA